MGSVYSVGKGGGGILALETYSYGNRIVHLQEQHVPLKIKYQFLLYAVFCLCYLKGRSGFEFILCHQTTPHRAHKA